MFKKLRKKKISIRDQVRFAKRLSAFIGTGIPLPEALVIINRSGARKRRRGLDHDLISGRVSKGELFSDVLLQSGQFDHIFIAMICIGEQSGALDSALLHAADMLESRDALMKKIIGAMVYPALIGFATLMIAAFLVLYIFPKIIPLIVSMNIPLPILTRILMIVSALCIAKWPWIILIMIVSIASTILAYKKFKIIGIKMRRCLFFMPIVGNILYGRIIVEIFGPLGLLLEHGETLPSAMAFLVKHIHYHEFSSALALATSRVNHGAVMSESLTIGGHKSNYLFQPIVIDLLEMGEKTGGIAGSCTNIAHIYKAEAEESISHLSHVIEPILMLGMGVVVGSIALSIVMPIYEITNHLSH